MQRMEQRRQEAAERVARRRTRFRAGLVALVASAALAVVALGPAQAETIGASSADGPAVAGEAIVVQCPEGWTFVDGTATFYAAKGPRALATVALEPVASDPMAGTAVAPRRAARYHADFRCLMVEPAPTTTTEAPILEPTSPSGSSHS